MTVDKSMLVLDNDESNISTSSKKSAKYINIAYENSAFLQHIKSHDNVSE